MDVIPPEDLITFESRVQEDTREYRELVNSNQWEPATRKEKSQDQPLLSKSYTVDIYQWFKKALNKFGFKILHSVNGSGSGGGSSVRHR